jgi:hypothetical protein
MATPVDIATELNKLILQQNQNLLNQSKIQRNQLTMMQKMVELMGIMNPGSISADFEKLNEELKKVDENLEALGGSAQEHLAKVAEETAKLKQKQEEAAAASERWEKTLDRLGKATMVASSFFGGMGQAIGLLKAGAGGLFDVLSSVTSSIFNLGVAIISAPFKMLGNLLEEASSGGGSELKTALEGIRKQFGDLATGSSKAIITMAKSMKGELANTGLSVNRIFGTLAERLEAISEYAKQLGPLFTNLSGDLMKNAEAFGAYAKGLGLTEEGMRGVGMTALTTGKSFTEVGREVTSFAFQMGDAFGVNGKEISRDVATMMKDVKNFGNLSVKQLTQVTVYARKLGLEFKDMQGVIDKFDNFEDAAEGAAQLSQAFGMNVNALELVQEQDPAARFDKLRKAFYATGKSVESMTRQELKLLAAQTGLSEEAVKLGFAQANQGVGYDEIQKKAGAAEKKQLTQAEAMEKLAGSIERMVKSGGNQTRSFFDAFANGFTNGIKRSQEYRQMMRALSQSLKIVFQAGRQVGKAFVDAFPGIKDFFGGIRDFFNPTRMKKLMSGVVDTFKKFFKDVSEGKGTSFGDLMKNLKKKFFDFFSLSEGPGRKIMTGIKDFAKGLVTILAGLAKEAMAGLTTAFKFIAEFIKDPSKAFAAVKGAGGGIMSSIMELLQPLFDAVVEAWPALKDSFVELLENAWEKLKPVFIDLGKKALMFIFGMGVLKAGMAGIGILALEAGKIFVKGFAQNIMAGKGIGGAISNAFKTGLGGASKVTSAITSAGEGARAVSGAEVQTPKSSDADWKNIAKLALGIAAAAVIMAGAYVAIEKVLQLADTSIGRVMEVGAVLGTMALTFVTAGTGMALLSKAGIKPGDMAKALLSGLAVGAAVAGLAGAYVLIDNILPKDLSENRIEMIGDVLWIMTKTFGLVGLGMVGLGAIGSGIMAGIVFALAGIAAIGVGIAAMTLVFMGLYIALDGIDMAKVETIEKVLDTMMFSFAATGLILIEAAAIGALILGTVGVGAAAMTAGMSALTLGVIKMADTAIEIMEKLSKADLGSGFDSKVTSFLSIMETIVSMGNTMTNLMKAAQPSVWDSIFGNNSITTSIDSLGTFVANMTGSVKTFLVEVVNLLVAVPEASLNTFSKFSTVLTSLVGLINALVPNFGNFEVDEGDINDFKAAIDASTKFFKSNLKSIEGFLPAVTEMLKQFSGVSFNESTVSVLSAAFGGIGALLGTVPNILSTIGTATRNIKSSNSSKADAQAFVKVSETLPGIFTSIADGLSKLGPAMGGAISSILNVVKDLSVGQMKKAEVAFGMVGTMLYYSKEFLQAGLKSGAGEAIGQNADGSLMFAKGASSLGMIFDDIVVGIESLGDAFPGLIRTVTGAFKNIKMKEVKGISEKFKVFFEVISTAAGLAKSLKDMGPDLAAISAGGADTGAMTSGGANAGSLIDSVSQFILQISVPFNNLISTIKTSLTGLKQGEFERIQFGFKQMFGLFSYIKDFSKAPEAGGLTDGATLQTSIVSSAEGIMNGITTAATKVNELAPAMITATAGLDIEGIAGAAKNLEKAVTEDTSKTLTAVVDRLNKINRDLTSIAEAPTDLSILLQKAADNLSLKGKGALTINKPDFTVNINVEVKLEADTFESTLISRPGQSKFQVKGSA